MFSYLGYLLVLLGIYVLARTLGWIHKKQVADDRPEAAKKVDRYIGLGFSVLLCVAGVYLSMGKEKPEPAKTTATPQTSSKSFTGENLQYWDEEMKSLLIQQCLENGKRTAEKYPDIVQDYCKCATEKITLAFTPEQYGQTISKSPEEQRQIISPVIESCVAIMNKLIELSQDVQAK
ncbi:MAG: hypothetical protein IPM34_10255 [Saprospiraceae bacterium]|nr:hypothetical protein [Saprospiraceae bacterium]